MGHNSYRPVSSARSEPANPPVPMPSSPDCIVADEHPSHNPPSPRSAATSYSTISREGNQEKGESFTALTPQHVNIMASRRHPNEDTTSFEGSTNRNSGHKPDFLSDSNQYTSHLRKPPPHSPSEPAHGTTCLSRITTNMAEAASFVVGWLATATIINSNQAKGSCPSPDTDTRWPAMLAPIQILPEPLRCPNKWMLLAGLSAYSSVGFFHLLRGTRYWADCGLVAMVTAIATGLWFGKSAMMDTFILGGFLSLLCSKIIYRFIGGSPGCGNLCQASDRKPSKDPDDVS